MHRLVNTEKGYTMTTRYLRGKICLDLAEHEYCKVAYDQGVLDDSAFMIANQKGQLARLALDGRQNASMLVLTLFSRSSS